MEPKMTTGDCGARQTAEMTSECTRKARIMLEKRRAPTEAEKLVTGQPTPHRRMPK